MRYDHFHENYPWRIVILSKIAKMLGLLVHIEGRPYGTARNLVMRPSGEGY